ncbi:MAG TPA: phosphatase PAP2 family protein [Mycobacteriales bacterium]
MVELHPRAVWVAGICGLAFLVLSLLVGLGLAGVGHVDVTEARALTDETAGHPGYVSALRFLTNALSPTTFRVLGLVVAVALLVIGERRLAVWVVVAMVVGGALGIGIKDAIARHRPTPEHPIGHFGGFSYPSGHALNAALGCGVLLIVVLPMLSHAWRRVAWVVAVVLVTLTGWTRLALGAHYLSDVVGGWLLGVCVIATTLVLLRVTPLRWPRA